ncbi:MAG TPA: DegT/DnrJ/EryC1/StrS family aminotransferase [Candidatus Paceibacterota bacterium]|nr:DegT/DnrJ/EryC1/StrS family aminotransferase [Candidatus Paceibacterota bacterium]
MRQLERIDTQHSMRAQVFNRYRSKLAGVKGIAFPELEEEVRHAGHMFVVWVDPKRRDAIRDALAKKGIQTSIHYDPIHLEPHYRKRFGYKKGDFPTAERLGASTITLPTYSKLSRAKQDHVIRELIQAVQGGK